VAELEARESARLQFFATLSHELRNPLHAIHTNAQLIKSRAKDVETSRPADAIERQVGRLTEILDDLLDVVKIAQGEEMHLATVSLQQVVGDAVEAARRSMDLHRRELHVQVPEARLHIKGDAPRLTRAVANLVSNAIKYSPQQGEILVRVFEEGGEGVVAVRDSGIGIAPQDLDRIFHLFTAGSVQHDASGGLGLGLHITRELVELHGGRVEARSEGPGKGSEFFIRLALTEDQPKVEVTPRATYADNHALRILVVDDNRDAADSLAVLLEMHGHTGLVAYDGPSALAKAEKMRPHVALVDIGMPAMNGLEVAQRISGEDWGRNTVLVAVTGWGARSDRAKTRAAGFAYHLTKPVDYDTLASLLSSVARKPPGNKP
jgi:CheY-like chemotaxis protein